MNTSFIIVSYCTTDLLKRAVESCKQFYPAVPVCVVDGSPLKHECSRYVQQMQRRNPLCRVMGKNIGHGPGMNIGMAMITTRYAVLMDSDAVIRQPGVLEAMMQQMQPGVYGTGPVVYSDYHGHNTTSDSGFPYLHPYFCMIDSFQYRKFPPFIHHGAPMLQTMMMSPVVVNFPVENYVQHDGRGTRELDPVEFKKKTWQSVTKA